MIDPFVSVIIPHYNDLRGLDLCLHSLAEQTYPRDRLEILVADNGSAGGEEAVANVINGRALLVVAKQRGAGPARNAGASAARGEVLAFTDADCRPEAGWLAAGVAALGDCDFAGGAMKVIVDDTAAMTGPEAFEAVFAFDNASYVRKKGFTVTANLFCPRQVFDAVGGFRVGVSEDLEWSHRAREAGYRIGYASEAVVGHPARRSWPELRDKWRRLTLETFQLYIDRPGGRMRWFARSLLLPLSAAAHTPRVLSSSRLSSMRARWAALRTLYRLRFWRLGQALSLLAKVRDA